MDNSRTLLALATILSFRMLGLFMIFPVFAVNASTFTGANPTLIGMALGIYGLTQALLQLPLSTLSDYIGRRPVVVAGLVLFLLGSIISALTHQIYFLILGRALQGAGAIGSTLLACVADITNSKNRTKAMAFMGITIGLSFAIAMVIGPLVNHWFALRGIFWLTALFALIGIILSYHFIDKLPLPTELLKKTPLLKVIRHLTVKHETLPLNISILLLHMLFTANFIAIPLSLAKLGLTTSTHNIYLPVLIGAFLVTYPLLMISEKLKRLKQVSLAGILFFALSEGLFYWFPQNKIMIILGLFLFFSSFTLLEAMLPSLMSKQAPPEHKGSAMGLFSTFQFFGIFLGGALGGILRTYYDSNIIFTFGLCVCFVWILYIINIKAPFRIKLNIEKPEEALIINQTQNT